MAAQQRRAQLGTLAVAEAEGEPGPPDGARSPRMMGHLASMGAQVRVIVQVEAGREAEVEPDMALAEAAEELAEVGVAIRAQQVTEATEARAAPAIRAMFC